MPNEEICLKESTPVGTLGIIPLESCKELGAKVNNYLVNWRQERDADHYDTSHSLVTRAIPTLLRPLFQDLVPAKLRVPFYSLYVDLTYF